MLSFYCLNATWKHVTTMVVPSHKLVNFLHGKYHRDQQVFNRLLPCCWRSRCWVLQVSHPGPFSLPSREISETAFAHCTCTGLCWHLQLNKTWWWRNTQALPQQHFCVLAPSRAAQIWKTLKTGNAEEKQEKKGSFEISMGAPGDEWQWQREGYSRDLIT